MMIRILVFLIVLQSLHMICQAQNIADRAVTFDPLGDHDADTAGFTWLNSARLCAEFSRYSDGSGPHHRWNAKTGGFFEVARWDSSWSIMVVGTMEMVADPFSDIAFNPRGIFWEEGVMASMRLSRESALQFGYIHRCKHDIDNLEPWLLAGKIEQITLVYSGLATRLLLRPRLIVEGPLELYAGLALRNDFFLHLFDQREPIEAHATGRSMNTLANATNIMLRLDLRPRYARYGLHLNTDFMLSLFGEDKGFGGRWSGLTALGAVPFMELGLDLFNPDGAAFTIFARGEWQRENHIVPFATSSRLFLMGIRASMFESMW